MIIGLLLVFVGAFCLGFGWAFPGVGFLVGGVCIILEDLKEIT